MIDETMERVRCCCRHVVERVVTWLKALSAWWCAWLAGARATRRIRRRFRREPLRSTKADAKRRAHHYAKRMFGRDIAWKAARKKLLQIEREGRELGKLGKVERVERVGNVRKVT